MANEITKILDTITPEQYTKYTNWYAEQHSAFIQSGILVPTPTLDQMIVAGGLLVTMPEWSKTALVDQVLAEDKALETGKTSADKQVAPVLYRGTGAAYTDLAAITAGSNPATQILSDFGVYTIESDQEILQAIIKALFAKGTGQNKGALADSHVSDQSAAKNPVICPEMVIDARSILGTSRSKLSVIAMHSKVKAELEKQNTQTKGNNMLYVRRARVIHPFGLAFENAQVSGLTPTNADLALPKNWKKVREDKKIGLVCLRHKISADLEETTPTTEG